MSRLFNFKNTGKSIEYIEKINETNKKSTESDTVFGIKLPLQKGEKSKNRLFKMCTTLEESINNNVKTFLMTKKGEKLGQASFGTSIHDFYNATDESNLDEEAVSQLVNELSVYFPSLTLKEYVSEKIHATDTEPAYFKLNITYIVGNKTNSVTIDIKTAS